MAPRLSQARSKLNQRIRRERRRLGRFVAFSEMLADLTPKPLFDKASSSGANLDWRRDPKPTT